MKNSHDKAWLLMVNVVNQFPVTSPRIRAVEKVIRKRLTRVTTFINVLPSLRSGALTPRNPLADARWRGVEVNSFSQEQKSCVPAGKAGWSAPERSEGIRVLPLCLLAGEKKKASPARNFAYRS